MQIVEMLSHFHGISLCSVVLMFCIKCVLLRDGAVRGYI